MKTNAVKAQILQQVCAILKGTSDADIESVIKNQAAATSKPAPIKVVKSTPARSVVQNMASPPQTRAQRILQQCRELNSTSDPSDKKLSEVQNLAREIKQTLINKSVQEDKNKTKAEKYLAFARMTK